MRTSLVRNLVVLSGAGALLLSGCGSSGSPDASGTAPQSYGGPQNGTQNGTRGQNGPAPGANGKVAAVDGSTAQVQNATAGQVAVTWNGSTTFTKQVSTTRAAVKTGVCVAAEPTSDSSSSSQTEVTAASVRITAKTNGSCTPVLRGGGPQLQQNGGGPQTQGDGPGGPPTDGAAPDRTQLRGFGAFGEVTGVTANGFTVTATMPTGQGTSDTETRTVTVTVTSATTYTTTAKGAASDVKVGVCVRAEGTTDSTGAVTAKTIAVTPPVDGQCGGMVFRRDGAPDSGGAGSTTTKVS